MAGGFNMILMSRRALSTLQKTVVAVVLIAVIGGVGYGLGWFNRPPKAAFTYRTPTRTLKYIAPTDRDLIIFQNESTDPETPLEKLISNWHVRFNGTSDWKLLNSSTHHWGRLPASNEKGHEIKLIVSDGAKEDSMVAVLPVDHAYLAQYPARRLGIPIKGIDIDSRFVIDDTLANEALEVIKSELKCNGVHPHQNREEVIIQCAKLAIDKRFESIVLAPRYGQSGEDIDFDEYITRLVRFSRKAEELRKTANSVTLEIGVELSYQLRGVYNGSTYRDRIEEAWVNRKRKEVQDRLHSYLLKLVRGIRENFQGKLVYSKGGLEEIRWDQLDIDIIGGEKYFATEWFTKESHLKDVLTLKKFGRPVFITDFGCASYRGATRWGGDAWRRYAGEERSQEEQANGIEISVENFEGARVDAIFLFEFIRRDLNDANTYAILEYRASSLWRRKLGFYAYQSFVAS